MELILAILVLFPIMHVLLSSRSYGFETFAWFLVVFFFSWAGWVVFVIVTQRAYNRRRGI